jgi:hypothetical protein
LPASIPTASPLIMGIAYGFLIELLTSTVFKSKPVGSS